MLTRGDIGKRLNCMEQEKYDLVLRWPREAGPPERLLGLESLPVAKMPRHIDVGNGRVWIAIGPDLIARFSREASAGHGRSDFRQER